MFEFIEEALDQVALAVEREIGFARRDAIVLGRDDRFDGARLKGMDQRIGVAGFVGEKGLRRDVVEQRLSPISALPKLVEL